MEEYLLKNTFTFNDFDHFASMVEQADIQHEQLDRGSFEGNLIQVICGPIIISTHKMNRTILQYGTGIKGYTTFLIPGNMEQDFSWRKNRLQGNVIGVLHSNMEHSCITRPDFYGTPVSIENQFLEELSNILGYGGFCKFIRTKEAFMIHEKLAKELHQKIVHLCSNEISDKTEITFELPKLIIESISLINEKPVFLKGTTRGILFKRAQDFIHGSFDESLSVKNLCHEIGTSERSLRHAFTEKSGLSPKKYIHNFRLNKARKLLKSGRYEKVIMLPMN